MTKITSLLIYCLVRVFQITYRFRYVGNDKLIALAQKKQNYIFAIWHQNLFGGILAQSGLPHIVIISKSKDAEPVAFTCKRLGHLVVRGSSKKAGVDKGGALAKDEMIEHLNIGHPGAVTVDGPKGPAFKVKPGIIDMAKKSQSLLVPYAVVSNSFWQFNSWDNFQLPKPFAKLIVAYGDPLPISADCTEYENNQIKLEGLLNDLTSSSREQFSSWQQLSRKNWFL